MTSEVQRPSVISWAVGRSKPSAISAAYIEPPLQPTATETSIPSRCSTFHNPSAAAHLTPPEPITRATGRRLLVLSLIQRTRSYGIGGRGCQQAPQIRHLHFRGPLSFFYDIWEEVRVGQPDWPVELRGNCNDPGMVNQNVDGVSRPDQVVHYDRAGLSYHTRERNSLSAIWRLKAERNYHIGAFADGYIHGQRV